MRPRTRPVQSDDADFLFRLFRSSRADLAGLPDAILKSQYSIQQDAYTGRFGSDGQRIVLIDGIPAGRLWTSKIGDRIRIVDLAILPEFRGQGAGTELLADVLNRSGEAVLSVRKDNPAVRLYLRLGFQISEENDLDLEMTWRRSNAGAADAAPTC